MAKDSQDAMFGPPDWRVERSTDVLRENLIRPKPMSKEKKQRVREICAQVLEKHIQKWADDESPEGIAKSRRNERRFYAAGFRGVYEYVSENSKETKTCIWSPDGAHKSWDENYSGVTWVGIHGTDSICVVTLAEELDMTRVSGGTAEWRKEDIMCDFRRAAIYELEVLPNPPGQTFKKTFLDWMKSVQKPFGVVCVSGDSDKGCNGQKAIDFLKKEFTKEEGQSTLNFGTDKTVKTALSAFQLLCNKEFTKANEIEVSLMDPNYWITAYEYFKDLTIEELPIAKIKKYLVAINDPEFKGKEPDVEDLEMWLIKGEMAGEHH